MQFYWPVRIEDGAKLGQKFGENGVNYAQFGLAGHNGQDFVATTDTPVYAACDGYVTFLKDLDKNGKFKGFGNYARIANHDGWTYYAHLNSFVGIPREVAAGELIGRVDSTGFSTGPHLHFGFRPMVNDSKNGYGGCVDPAQYLLSPNERPHMIEFVHKTGTGEYGFLETTPYTIIYHRCSTEEETKMMAQKFLVYIFHPDGTVDFTKAKEITL